MTTNQEAPIKCFFGAANGYKGFKSYFDTIFDSKEFSHIFVIKGGPGTGKSTFMKKISKHFSKSASDIEEIYCSSDPNSLDGLIISSNNNRVAFLDGTAPHERDTKYPGATDEIINLGENFNTEKLKGYREKIVELSDIKSNAYKNAYGYMKIAGEAFEFIKSKYESYFNDDIIIERIEEILSSITPDTCEKRTTRLISSFGKYGYNTLDTLDKISEKTIEIPLNYTCCGIFLTRLKNTAKKLKLNYTLCPSPLSPSLTEAVYFPNDKITIKGNYENIREAGLLLNLPSSSETESAEKIEDEAKKEAIKWFNDASNAHFELEKIYYEAVNFEKNEEMLENKIKETEYLLAFEN